MKMMEEQKEVEEMKVMEMWKEVEAQNQIESLLIRKRAAGDWCAPKAGKYSSPRSEQIHKLQQTMKNTQKL